MFHANADANLDQVIAALHDRSQCAYYAITVTRQLDGSYTSNVTAMPTTGALYATSPLSPIPSDSIYAATPLAALARAFTEVLASSGEDPVLG